MSQDLNCISWRGFFFAVLLAHLVFAGSRTFVATASEPPQISSAVTADCSASNARVSLSWRPAPGAIAHWVDLSMVDDEFGLGTFAGYGPLGPDANSLSWDGLEPGIAHFWRVHALTASGWSASDSGSFVACGGPAVLPASVMCEPDGTATINFRWAPSSDRSEFQWLDLSVQDNGFEAGTFVSSGPVTAGTDALSWPGIQSNTLHFFRVSRSSAWGAWSSYTATVFPCPAPSREPAPPPAIPGPEMQG
jgi:hypothetical protein